MKFYPSDWRSDPRLRMCSLGARGLWLEMIALMHEAEPYGHLLVNGKPVTNKQLASLCGCSVDEVTGLVIELEQAGVFSVTIDGLVFSRRMVRDREKANRDKQNGGKGGNPTLNRWVNPEDKAQKLEARIQNLETEEPPSGGDNRDGQPDPIESPLLEANTDLSEGKIPPPEYAFESGIIRLRQDGLDAWIKAFSHLDVRAELFALTEWAQAQGPSRWFHAVAGALAKRNREVKIRVEQEKTKPNPRKGTPFEAFA